MSGDGPTDALLLGPRTRLLHIGPMKTGTTTVQVAANARRQKLLDHGVRYPGDLMNHRRHLGALMGWSVDTWRRSGPLRPDRFDADTDGVPPPRMWDELRGEMDADPQRRILITHEFVSQADDATAQRVVDELGDRIHICITLRTPGQILPSLWAQEIMAEAETEPFTDWLARVYGQNPDHPMSERFQRAYDQGHLVERWARLVGPANVTVIIVDKSDPTLLTSAFEGMLGLPAGMLDSKPSNSSLPAIETELFRKVNRKLTVTGADWLTFYNLVWKGAIRIIGRHRRDIAEDEPRVLLPSWAADIADKDGRRFAESIQRSGVQVVGDLDQLAAESRAADSQDLHTIPIDIAANAVSAAILAGRESGSRQQIKSRSGELVNPAAVIAELHQQLAEQRARPLKHHVRTIPADERAQDAASALTTHDLVAALKRRLAHKLRTGRSYSVPGRPG